PQPQPKADPTPPRATPPRNTTPTRPTTPATQPSTRPPAQREAPGLNLSELTGPQRQTGNTGRPATGQQGRGSAPQAAGPQLAASFNKVYDYWAPLCDIDAARSLRIQMDITLSRDGRITSGPTLVNPQPSSIYRAAAEGAIRALRQAQPFDVPANFEGGQYRPSFNTERACANR
ncbi:hypothetical protein, partial [uncultured Brevundimonas sp.]|uniref:hypothetical protein n=1 Tax=uncultured Brevundimonas sp. TaxID=213418 RepID=UPI00261B129C